MTAAVFVGRRRVRLDDRNLIGEGGEGRVYRDGDLALKVFTAPSPARAQKLRDFPTQLPSRVIAPIELVTNDAGAVVGFSMRALDRAVDLHRLSQRRWREGRVTNDEVMTVFRDLSATVERLHGRGIVIGDLNDGNVVVTPPSTTSRSQSSPTQTWTPWLIDADSMQFGAHRCVVAHERFLDPRLYGVDLERRASLSRESDWYALAVLVFGSLLYVHPFGGSHPSYGTLLRRAEARLSVLRKDVKLPNVAHRPDILTDNVLGWFERVFEHDLREPLPSPLIHARFTRCSCGVEHTRSTCPVCTTRVHVAPAVHVSGSVRGARVFATRTGRILTAVFEGGLKYVYEEDGTLVREDGSRVLSRDEHDASSRAANMRSRFAHDPHRVVRIAGNATWVGADGNMTKITAGRIIEAIPVGLARGELAADASTAGLVHVHDDWLVRAEGGTRIGQVLDGQTFVRLGAALGFAFYRAGALTVAFVFDPRRGVLRQIERFPPIEGKLLGWSAVFDEAHVVVTFATEERGRVCHTAHLVDARGELVASDSDRDPDAVLPPSLVGRALAGAQLLVATDGGLLLVRADRSARRFAAVRLFPETKDFVSPDAELLVGPGGSVFVVTHDEITQLTFAE